jgi:ABC-type nitrate/sulfonate/bicarbonate transport system permease component
MPEHCPPSCFIPVCPADFAGQAGSVAAMLVGLLFVAFPKVEKFLDPYLNAMNVMPRIALAPLFILWFGLGLGSKIAVGCSLTFFIVLSSTVAGIRGVSQDHVLAHAYAGLRSLRLADGPDEVHCRTVARIELMKSRL